ncbi:RNA polymerase sigma-70 factor [Microlunatus soli]|nr:RNA polymerase sigma-70 factor [Microlunatus soli]
MARTSSVAPEDRELSAITDPATEIFLAHRNLLFTVAYELLGSAADAEDVVQETWLRWTGVELDAVRDQRAYLIKITTRQAVDRLRTLARRKETYIGPWLPEPLLTTPDIADDVVLADSISLAMLTVLETLTPTERAVFVLREVFGLAHDEIAEAVDKSPAAVRQIAHRARRAVAVRRPRAVADPVEGRAVAEAFRQALRTGDLQGLLEVLAPDVVLVADGGGIRVAVQQPLYGADAVADFFRRVDPPILRPAVINGKPALIADRAGEIETVISLHIADGAISRLSIVRNPHKLGRLNRETRLTR